MKKQLIFRLTAIIMAVLPVPVQLTYGQGDKAVIADYLTTINPVSSGKEVHKYRMTAVYTNRDLYGNFTGKNRISGVYTTGLGNGYVSWTDVSISASETYSGAFPEGVKQNYMENFRYVPSGEMLKADAFSGFPDTPDAVLAKNLVWDMMAFYEFGWNHTDSLHLNRTYRQADTGGSFAMGDIGTYEHKDIQINWTGISASGSEICNLIEFRAIDNMIELTMPGFSSKGTEQYWGTIWISRKTGLMEHAEMYGGTIQELNIQGMPDKMIMKTIRELWVDRIE